jgi:transposase
MRRQRHDERYWRERVEKWAASGLSAEEFASREGIRPERLFFWKRRLRASSAIAVAGVSFAKISVQAKSTEAVLAEPLEVLTRSGHVIRVRPRFDESTLLRLVSALGGA